MSVLRSLALLAVVALLGACAVRDSGVGSDGWLRAQEVVYQGGGEELQGYLVYDPAVKGPRPGVLVVHEWWGHNDYARQRAEMLARLGYTALAVDMYGAGRQARHPDEARTFARAVLTDWPQAQARFDAALRLLRAHPTVQAQPIAAIGYCFGGGVVLNMARGGAELAGVASFHGSLNALQPARPGQVKARLLVLNGAADTLVSAQQIAAFQQEMVQAGAQFKFVSYPGARHGFTNPAADRLAAEFKLPLGYHAEADRQSWAELQHFLRTLFADGA